MTVAAFLESFPEFTDVHAEYPTLLDAKLGEAGRRVSASVTGDLYPDLVGYLAAHLVATSPQGQQARQASDKGRTTYLDEYERLSRVVPIGTMYA